MSQRPSHCDVCGARLCPTGRAVTGLCSRCREAGARFQRRWMADLRARGATYREIAIVVGTTENTVGARLWEAQQL